MRLPAHSGSFAEPVFQWQTFIYKIGIFLTEAALSIIKLLRSVET